ncbi:MAG: GAF domain-containing protein [Anaerolineaceae bacterium]|nr:GAF domain-containing protein [Anaerolineaceae bacterium]
MDTVFNAAIATSSGLYACLLIYVQIKRRQLRVGRIWLSAILVFAALIDLILVPQFSPYDQLFTRGFGLSALIISTLAVYGYVVLTDISAEGDRLPRLWLVASAIWLIGFVASEFTTSMTDVGEGDWVILAIKSPTAPAWILLVGFVLCSLILLVTAFWAFFRASLPETANRVLFWMVNCFTMLLASLLLISGTTILVLLGVVTLLVACAGAIYGSVSYQVFDIRNATNRAIRTTLLVGLTALIVFVALYITNRLNFPHNAESNVLLAAIAIAVGSIYVPARKLVEMLINPIFRANFTDAGFVTRQFSQQISQSVELEKLVTTVISTLNKTMKVRKSGLLMVIDTGEGKVEVQPMQGSFPELNNIKRVLYKKSPLYQQFATAQAPVSQFEMEFNPKYQEMLEIERDFFQSLHTSAYAPIIVEGELTGILACGSKLNDSPFYPHDLALLATLANQTGVALRNAHLVADLRKLNDDTALLNSGLASANQQMGKLDAVKTDFVTIASHELRTPLAQMRGYTDIMDALNGQGMLDIDKTSGMIDNMRKATERMEELISAMLDVSQLDVNAMDLRFAQTTIETVVRMAVEPLTDAIKQRKLTLSARGLKGLPVIEADLQRLVQAFRNVVVNAIKFTPDKGRIEVTASLHTPETHNEPPAIMVAITDTGVGISPENIDLIFQKFFRGYDPGLHSTGTYKFMGAGPGLGLTIAKGVIEGHGGKIWAESLGHDEENFLGSTFYILLPLKSPETVRRVAMEKAQ